MDETRSIVEKIISGIKELTAADFPIRKIPVVEDCSDCLEIFKIILDAEPPMVLVFDKKGKYKGIISLLDLLSFFSTSASDLPAALSKVHVGMCIEAQDLMKGYIPVAYDNDKVSEITRLMAKYQITVLPRAHSKDNKEILGVIWLRDIITKFKELSKHE